MRNKLILLKMMESVMEGKGREVWNGCIFTTDSGFGKNLFLSMFSKFGVAFEFFMPDHLL